MSELRMILLSITAGSIMAVIFIIRQVVKHKNIKYPEFKMNHKNAKDYGDRN